MIKLMFIPATPEEVKARGWSQLDVILVNGDATIDSPFSGISLIARQLEAEGFKVGIIAQPDPDSKRDITRLGEPALFWGVSAGVVDSMVANYTALRKPRKLDDHTPGGLNNLRPDRACIAYSNLIRKYFKMTRPIVLGGIEASLRRLVHYDYWSDTLRRSILLDAKADYILYGMADLSVLEFARALRDGTDPKKVRGLCYPSVVKPEGYLELPSYEECLDDKVVFAQMFDLFYKNNDPVTAQGLAQRHTNRYIVQNPPARTPSTAELDKAYALPYTYAVHPYDAAKGEVRAFETIRHSIVTHRGCYGECSFCAIAVHEGRRVTWRSQESILDEAREMTKRPGFKGIITDISGPTANMYGYECPVKGTKGACRDQSCIYPQVCPVLPVSHDPQTALLKALRELPGVRKVFVSSGIRPDLVMADANFGEAYMDELVRHHVSGQLKLAPEHSEPAVLRRMRKPSINSTLKFKESFDQKSKEIGKEQFLTYYMIAAYPGCGDAEMMALQEFCAQNLGVLPEQVQIFTPTPSTYGSLMYYTERDPWTGEQIFVEKGLTGKMQQKALITGWRKKRELPVMPKMPEREPRKFNKERRERRAPRPVYLTDRTDHHKAYQPPRPQAETPQVRVIKDDQGRFLHNRLPEGWVVKEEQKPRGFERDERRPSGRRGAGEPARSRAEKPLSWDRRTSERSAERPQSREGRPTERGSWQRDPNKPAGQERREYRPGESRPPYRPQRRDSYEPGTRPAAEGHAKTSAYERPAAYQRNQEEKRPERRGSWQRNPAKPGAEGGREYRSGESKAPYNSERRGPYKPTNRTGTETDSRSTYRPPRREGESKTRSSYRKEGGYSGTKPAFGRRSSTGERRQEGKPNHSGRPAAPSARVKKGSESSKPKEE
ncbi:MAG: YgiQ family radical SAM protein [Anaerolineaceae bacterium]|nr:YgiQ family radical SAM protein [Anaerolineaceae bacterium]